ncbi:MAG: hypothetical protein LWY06_10865 [Firmicutes bacterium]|nr:hypothetical protein [Bacillota bacterium]
MTDIEKLRHKKHRAGLSGILLERATGVPSAKIARFLRGELDLLNEDEYGKIIEACNGKSVFERLFENCGWKRKYRNKKPEGEIIFTWHIDKKDEVSQAKHKVKALKEESMNFYRSICLEDTADGQVISIVQHYWH